MKTNQRIIKGTRSHVWLRPLRYLLEHGSPLAPTVGLCVGPTSKGALPLGAICETRDRRLIFWPPLPKNIQIFSDDGKRGVSDHITLELDNHEIHVTSFDADGDRRHHRDRWKLPPDEFGLSLWFNLLARWSLIDDQDLQVEVDVRMPTSDAERRTAEYRTYAQHFGVCDIKLPENQRLGNYVYCGFYLLTKSREQISQLPKRNLSLDIAGYVDDWPDGESCDCYSTTIRVGRCDVLVAAGCPPGNLKDDIICGFPTLTGHRA